MNLTCFYHLWQPGDWHVPYAEFMRAANRAGCPLPIVCHVIGPSEAPTLNRVRDWALKNDGAVLYAHTKGAADNSDFNARWRQSMTRRLVESWRVNLALLEANAADAAGCHWLTREDYPGQFGYGMTEPADGCGFFGGNFWMARCDYLRTLPPCPEGSRYDAEAWIGINHPRVVDLLPGWPSDDLWPELCA